MTLAVQIEQLLAYSDHERSKWEEWALADPRRLELPYQAGGSFPTVWSVFDHLFLVERRHLARLEGSEPPETTGVATGDARALFDYAHLVRADFREYLRELTDALGSERQDVTIRRNTVTMSRRRLIAHILLHEARHLAQVAYVARAAAIEPPGNHDLFYFEGFD